MRPLATAPEGGRGTAAAPADGGGPPGTPAPPEAPGSVWDRSTRPGRLLGAVDDGADRFFEPLRQVRVADTAARLLSNLADYGFVWALLAAVKARRAGPARRRAVVALAVAGVVSAGVNTGVKRVVRRQRPAGADGSTPAGGQPDTLEVGAGPPAAGGRVLPVRRPRSSSFPSGHTLAAFCTAVVLGDGAAERSAYLAFAGAVAVSRVHLRAHHASDVLGGALIGTVAGAVARRAVTGLTGRAGSSAE